MDSCLQIKLPLASEPFDLDLSSSFHKNKDNKSYKCGNNF